MPRPAAKPIGSPLPTAPLIVSAHEAQIIAALRKHDTISRTDIVRLTGWSRPKVTTEVGKLAKRGILIESGEGASQGGRRPRLLKFNHQLGCIVGMDIGATSMDIAIADLNAQVLARDSGPADVRDEPLELLGAAKQRVLALLAKLNLRPQQVLGVGVGVPGPVDFLKGILVAPPLMPAWEGFSIRGYFHAVFPSAFVAVDNDVNIMALGELRGGAGMGQEDFIFVKIGTGIGAGIVCNGNVHRGHNGSAGDIGHICADHNGPICRCGNVGCLEAMAAGPAIADRATEAVQNGSSPILAQKLAANNGVLRAEDVAAAVREGDRASIEIVQRSGQLIGDVLAGLVNFFNPSMILVGGGVSNIGNQLLASIRQAVLRRSTALATRELIVSYSPMSGDAGVTGAIHLALEHLFVVQDKSSGA
jgi:glucokinase-like ROK family protein